MHERELKCTRIGTGKISFRAPSHRGGSYKVTKQPIMTKQLILPAVLRVRYAATEVERYRCSFLVSCRSCSAALCPASELGVVIA
jgi:hypothetical protein